MTCPGAVSVAHMPAGCLGSCSKSKAELFSGPCPPQTEPCAPVGPHSGAQLLWHLAAAGRSFAGPGTSPPSIPRIALWDFFEPIYLVVGFFYFFFHTGLVLDGEA